MFGFQNYPTNYEDINFNKIKRLMQLFPECSFGYADHTAWNEPNNVLITLMGAALGMDYVEKHVTNVYGQERIDWNSAVSIETFNEIAEKLGILSRANSDGSIMLNNAEKNYSTYGKMKKAAILKTSVNSGDVFNLDVIEFKRVGEESDISQIDVVGLIGRKFSQDLPGGSILLIKYFAADE